jgi:hypothetical protein
MNVGSLEVIYNKSLESSFKNSFTFISLKPIKNSKLTEVLIKNY